MVLERMGGYDTAAIKDVWELSSMHGFLPMVCDPSPAKRFGRSFVMRHKIVMQTMQGIVDLLDVYQPLTPQLTFKCVASVHICVHACDSSIPIMIRTLHL